MRAAIVKREDGTWDLIVFTSEWKFLDSWDDSWTWEFNDNLAFYLQSYSENRIEFPAENPKEAREKAPVYIGMMK